MNSTKPLPVRQNKISGVMWKTVSEACNLACDYCYYSRCNGRPGKINKIQDEVLEKFIKEYMKLTTGVAPFAWQGGEPLLAGLDFFGKVVELQAKYAPDHTIITNSIQTNGTLINKEWASFFKTYNFLVGVSIDGPKQINDARRVTRTGKGSFTAIMNGIQHLKDAGVPFNILTVIHEDNVTQASELMDFYHQNDFRYVQFIPCMDFLSQDIDQAGQFLISPKQYGDFLCEAFDNWYNNGKPDISIRFFDNILAVNLNHPAELCTLQEVCPKTVVFEQNGDAYPCDFFIHNDFKLGNIGDDSLEEILANPIWDDFLNMKPNLPEQCRQCEFLNLCHGGCPRNRMKNKDELSVEYFCESYRQLFKHAKKRIEVISERLRS